MLYSQNAFVFWIPVLMQKSSLRLPSLLSQRILLQNDSALCTLGEPRLSALLFSGKSAYLIWSAETVYFLIE